MTEAGKDSPTEPESANFERLLRQQESLRQVIESISSELELRPLLTRIVRHACELIGADNGTIGLVDEQRHLIRTEAAYRMPAGELGAEMPPGVGLAGQVLLTRQPLILDRYGQIEQTLSAELDEYAVIGLPIFWRDRMIGFFGIGAAPPRSFHSQDLETLALFARHAAIAIVNARLFDETRTALQEKQFLYETSYRISTAMDVNEVIRAYLEQVAARRRYACTIVLYEFDEAGERSTVVVYGRWTPQDGLAYPEERIPYARDALDPWLDAGQTITISNVHTDPRAPEGLRQLQIRSKRPALAMIPLMIRVQRIGLVVLSYPQVHAWPETDLQPYQTTAAQLATAIDSRRQQQLLVKRGQQIAVLEERQSLARDLHDSVTQLIFSMTLVAQSVAPAWRRDPAEGERRVNRLLELSQSALAEMRALLVKLRPPAALLQIQQEGLAVALHRHLADVSQNGFQFEFEAEGYTPQPFAQEEALYRIAQEALNNIVKYAQARQIKVKLGTDASSTRLTITDDGVGFGLFSTTSVTSPSEAQGQEDRENAIPVKEPGQTGGLGLTIMRERAQTLGGKVEVITAPGSGVVVAVTLPRQDLKP